MKISKASFGNDGVSLFTFSNDNQMTVQITNYGGIVTSLSVPDRNGKIDDVVLGFDSLEKYLAGHPYFGAIVGRVGSRITNGRFTLDGTQFTLPLNDGPNHLHGGVKGFDKVVWDAETFETETEVGLTLRYLSRDGEEGYPGNLSCTAVFTLNNADELTLHLEAETDKATPVNLLHHSYFNLKGEGNGDILDHLLTLHADQFTPNAPGSLIPGGEIENVAETPLDFRTPQTIRSRIQQAPGGYDHNYVLNNGPGSLRPAAVLSEPSSGRIMEIQTTAPAIQLYTGNFLDGTLIGKAGKAYQKQSGLCLETQYYPDSPNKPHFPSVILRPGEKYKHTTVYKFYAFGDQNPFWKKGSGLPKTFP